jgi:hypothetical protein
MLLDGHHHLAAEAGGCGVQLVAGEGRVLIDGGHTMVDGNIHHGCSLPQRYGSGAALAGVG